MSRAPHILLIIETSLAYGRGVLQGISRYVVAHRPWSMYLDQRELLAQPPAWLESWEGDGIICRSTTRELATHIRRMHIPIVDLCDVYDDLGLPRISTNHHAVGQMAAAHLLERGFRQFAFCGFSGHDWSLRRRDGFLDAMREAGCECALFESPWETTRDHSWEEQQQGIGDWLSQLPKPLGVLASNDLRGQQVLDACRREDLAVPEAVAVIGVDNDDLLCGLCAPPLSSVILNSQRVGYEAAAMLDRLMRETPDEPPHLSIEPLGVMTRQSTDVLAIDDPLVASAVKYIREHACQGIAVEDVLKHVPLSRSILEKRFRKFLKRSPQEEIRNVQLKRIKELLAKTDLSLEQIAHLAGYEHSEYMSVVFKREVGQTPGNFRRVAQL